MPALDQIYSNATNAFGMDPELRNLLMATMEQATAGGQPAPQSAAEQFMLSARNPPPESYSPQQMAQIRAQQSTQAKGDMLSPAPGTPPPGPSAPMPAAPPPFSPMRQFAPTAAKPTPAAAPVAMPRAAPPTTGQQISAFLRGLGTSDAILPAIGGGMAAVEGLEQQGQQRNQTIRALMSRGIDADTAQAAVSNPEVLKAILPGLFGGGERKLGEDYGEDGQPRKFFYNEKGPANIEYIGGSKKGGSTTALSNAQGRANIKRVEGMKTNAQAADEMLSNLSTLKTLREDTSYEGFPMGVSQGIAWAGDVTGMSRGRAINSTALNLQLGFTEKTKGAITDREMGMFAGAVPGLEMGDTAAQPVIAGMEAAALRVKERAKFFEKYLKVHENSLEGAEDAWEGYVNANPIITKNPDGTLKVNRSNIGNWKDYVGEDGQDPRTNFGPSPGDVNFSNPTSANTGSSAGGETVAPKGPTINTRAEYDALSPGSIYYDAEGNQAQKPKR